MPTIFIALGIYFRFYSREHEPIHVHIKTADGNAKFDIDPEIRLITNNGVKPKDLKHAEAIIEENRELFIKEWKNTFGE
ncbi:MAG: DUF4160 domain-containing protein [Paludibacter sp.]